MMQPLKHNELTSMSLYKLTDSIETISVPYAQFSGYGPHPKSSHRAGSLCYIISVKGRTRSSDVIDVNMLIGGASCFYVVWKTSRLPLQKVDL